MEQLRSDLYAASVPLGDADGRTSNFHSFRHTLATNLVRAGVSPRVAMEFMRHGDLRLTNKVYTDASLLPLHEAVEKLPRFTAEASGVLTAGLTVTAGAAGHPVSCAVAADEGENWRKPLRIKAIVRSWPYLSRMVA